MSGRRGRGRNQPRELSMPINADMHTNLPEQVGSTPTPPEGMVGIDKKELLDLIRIVMKEENEVIVSALASLKMQVEKCVQTVNGVETGLNALESRVTALEESKKTDDIATAKALKDLRDENTSLREKLEKQESHSRKFNVRVRGLSIGIEGRDPTAYMNNLLAVLFKDKIKTEPIVEIAHRVGKENKTMIMRMQRYMAKEEILALSKKERTITYGEMKLQFFPDISTEMAKRRDAFGPVRKKLNDAKVKHGIIHPATLAITHGVVSKRFTEHEKAELYWNTVLKPELERDAGERDAGGKLQAAKPDRT